MSGQSDKSYEYTNDSIQSLKKYIYKWSGCISVLGAQSSHTFLDGFKNPCMRDKVTSCS